MYWPKLGRAAALLRAALGAAIAAFRNLCRNGLFVFTEYIAVDFTARLFRGIYFAGRPCAQRASLKKLGAAFFTRPAGRLPQRVFTFIAWPQLIPRLCGPCQNRKPAPTDDGDRGPFGAIFSARRQKMTPRCGRGTLPPRGGRAARATASPSFWTARHGQGDRPGQRRHGDTSDAPLHLGRVGGAGAVRAGDKRDHNEYANNRGERLRGIVHPVGDGRVQVRRASARNGCRLAPGGIDCARRPVDCPRGSDTAPPANRAALWGNGHGRVRFGNVGARRPRRARQRRPISTRRQRRPPAAP